MLYNAVCHLASFVYRRREALDAPAAQALIFMYVYTYMCVYYIYIYIYIRIHIYIYIYIYIYTHTYIYIYIYIYIYRERERFISYMYTYMCILSQALRLPGFALLGRGGCLAASGGGLYTATREPSAQSCGNHNRYHRYY